MTKLLMRTVTLTLLALGLASASFAGDDQNQCSLKTLRGRYVFTAGGFNIDPSLGAQPKAIIEIIVFNGDGTLSVPATTRSLNGVVTRIQPSVGTYTVTEDCLGTITFAGPTFDIALSPRGNLFWLIQTNQGTVFQGSATRTSQEVPDDDQHP